MVGRTIEGHYKNIWIDYFIKIVLYFSQLLSFIYNILSLGSILMDAINDKTIYGYIVYPGNNSAVIEAGLRKRNVWNSLTSEKQVLSASFLWKPLNCNAKIYGDFDQILKYDPSRRVLLNHFQYNHVITTKSGLLRTLKNYYTHEPILIDQNYHIHDVIPTSYIIYAQKEDKEYKDFVQKFHQIEKKEFYKQRVPQKHCQKNVWFIKPQSDNQGKGIILSNSFKEIKAFFQSKPMNTGWIIQKAIERPLLYYGRKFDVRVWVLVTPQLQIFYYNTPYMRTSSSPYTTELLNSEIHLTNNCQQKHFTEYSKYQEGNTIPMEQTLLAYIETLPNGFGKARTIVQETVQKMKEIIIDTLMSARKYFGKGIRKKQFQLFGYDFLIDEDFRTWLLEVNNNPYLGVPNTFIKQLLPKMVDEMMQIVLDPIFPPKNYTPVEHKRFQLIHKQSMLRLSPVKGSSLFCSARKSIPKRERSFTKQKSGITQRGIRKGDVFVGMSKQSIIKPFYLTPFQSIQNLLQNYCYSDLEPFITPVSLLLCSPTLANRQIVEANIKKIKVICESRISKIVLQANIFSLCCNIISQDKYDQRIKTCLINAFTNACKTFKARIHIQKNLLSLVCQNLKGYKEQAEQCYVQAVIRLLIAVGTYFDRSVFIPGQSRQNQFIREFFIKSNSLQFLLYLRKKYSRLCNSEINTFLNNLSEDDWELFYEFSGNKSKRCYSPKINTVPEKQEERLFINAQAINDEKPRVLTLRQDAEIKNFRSRRNSGMSSTVPMRKQ